MKMSLEGIQEITSLLGGPAAWLRTTRTNINTAAVGTHRSRPGQRKCCAVQPVGAWEEANKLRSSLLIPPNTTTY